MKTKDQTKEKESAKAFPNVIWDKSGKFERGFALTPAFDRRSGVPEKNYGIHGVEQTFYLRGPLGTVQFVIYTMWNLPHVQKETDAKPPDSRFPYLLHKPTAADIGFHSVKRKYDGQLSRTDCHLTGGQCYYDGSSLSASEDVWPVMVTDGLDGLWKKMEEYYIRWSEETEEEG